MEVNLLRQQNQMLLEQLHLQQSHCRSMIATIAGSWVAVQPEQSTTEKQPPQKVTPVLKSTRSSDPVEGEPSQARDPTCERTKLRAKTPVCPLSTEPARSVLQDSVLISSFDQSRVPAAGSRMEGAGKFSKYRHAPSLSQDEVNQILKNRYGGTREYISNPLETARYLDSHDAGVSFADYTEVLDGTVGDATLTSTPTRSVQTHLETPKSILKRRKLIDNHVHVDSEFNHTPIPTVTPRKHGLNFSYSDIDDIEFARENMQEEMERMSLEEGLDGSYMEEVSQCTASSGQSSEPAHPSLLVSDRLLRDTGNDRQNASVARHLSQRPKSMVFDRDVLLEKKKAQHESSRERTSGTVTSKSKLTNPSKAHAAGKTTSLLSRDPQGPLLGYDWIAGVLDNEGLSMDLPDEFFDELRDFRRSNKDICSSASNPYQASLDLTKPIEPEVTDPGHTCIHGFTINDRLFPEAMNADEEGRSVCPVCLSTRTNPCVEEPGFVRVSIPRSTLESPYRVKPHRRKSFDSSDTFALTNHCLAGWETSKPSMIPAASSVDLKEAADGLHGKLSTTVRDAERLAKSFCRQMKNTRTTEDLLNVTAASGKSDLSQMQKKLTTMPSARLAPSARFSLAESILNTTTDTARSIPQSTSYNKRRTEELLNTTHALKMEQRKRQDEEQLMDISKRSLNNSRRSAASSHPWR